MDEQAFNFMLGIITSTTVSFLLAVLIVVFGVYLLRKIDIFIIKKRLKRYDLNKYHAFADKFGIPRTLVSKDDHRQVIYL